MGYKYLLERLQAYECYVKVLTLTLIIYIYEAKVQLDRPYDKRFFKRYLNSIRYKRNTQQSILTFFLTKKNKEIKINNEIVTESPQHPCLGWTNEEIKKYILYSPSSFGGGRRVEIIAKELWPDKFSKNFEYLKLSKNEEIILKNT